MVDAEIIRIATDFKNAIQGHLPVTGVILFGSRANGSGGPDSDIDIGVFSDVPADRYLAVLQMLYALRFDIDPRIEPHLFSEIIPDASGFAAEVLRNSVAL